MADSVRTWWQNVQDMRSSHRHARAALSPKDFSHLAKRIANVVEAAERAAVLLREQARKDARMLETSARERAAELDEAAARIRADADAAATAARDAAARDAGRVARQASDEARKIVGSAQRKAAVITATAHREQRALERAIAAAEARLDLLADALHSAATNLEVTLDVREHADTASPRRSPKGADAPTSNTSQGTGDVLEPVRSPTS